MLRYLLYASVLCWSQAQEYTVSTVDLAEVRPGDARIVGGTATTIQRFPYTVQVAQGGRLFCGGSLITARHVLSAAHCFIDDNGIVTSPRLISIRAGTSNLNSGGTTRQTSAIIVHERYSRVTHDADVAVLLLASALRLSNNIGLAAIPVQGSEMRIDTALIHVGWGNTVEGGQLANVLQEVDVYKVNHTLCVQRYQELGAALNLPYRVTENMICAGIINFGGADACQGDSGGPLVLQINRTVVVGITSWGHGCGQPRYPGVSARVSNFTTWIENTVRRYNSAPSLSLASSVLILMSVFASLSISKEV